MAALAIAQAILMNMLTRSHSSRGARAAELESFDGSRDKAEQFVQSIHIAAMMQLNTFMDKKMKILYALSFMHGGIAQVWAKNETNMILSHSSMFTTLAKLLVGFERIFGDPDQERTAHAQLYALKMTMGMMADEYMAKVQVQDAHRKNQLQQGATGGCIHPGPPSPNYFQGLLSDFVTIRLGHLEPLSTIWTASIGDSLS